MTVEVLHQLALFSVPLGDLKLNFVSLYGETASQFKINKGLVADKEIKPAAFSLSVFNTAPAQATIALGLKGGYTALYPRSFREGFLASSAALLAGDRDQSVFVYGDEAVPSEYAGLVDKAAAPAPLAFAALLSCKEPGLVCSADSAALDSPQAFLNSFSGKV
jgi:hypothetical protein